MEALRGRRVLVTGAGGFIGSTLTERLVRDGAEVRAFVRYNSRSHHGWIDAFDPELAGAVEIAAGDLRDPEAVRKAVDGRELIFHLGALVAIPYSYLQPFEFVQTNVVGTAHVLDACRRAGVERMVHTSTSEVYGSAQRVPIDEAHPLCAQSPYAASKTGADQLAASYQRSFGLPVVTLRPFNTFGPRQSARAVIPAVVGQALRETDVVLGSLHPTRDLTFVDDTVEAFVRAATAPGVEGEVFNVGSGRDISIGDLAAKILAKIGSPSRVRCDAARVRPRDSEVERLRADATRARERLGWEPRVTLDEGLERTITWLEKHLHLYKTGIYNV